jgi:hypothetical protein
MRQNAEGFRDSGPSVFLFYIRKLAQRFFQFFARILRQNNRIRLITIYRLFERLEVCAALVAGAEVCAYGITGRSILFGIRPFGNKALYSLMCEFFHRESSI